MDNIEIKKRIEELRKIINKADIAYYRDSKPIITDLEYDKLFDELKELENRYPEFKSPNSPTVRIGSDIDNSLPESNHTIPVLSLDKCYKISELYEWINKNQEKLEKNIEIVIEPKIDGASVVLYYNNGYLVKSLTRGNGYTGNDITDNIKTIKTIPLEIDYKGEVAIRCEVFINKKDFLEFNEKYCDNIYSNPRNLASGAIRRQKSKETAIFPLNIFCYEGYFNEKVIDNHIDNLIFLNKLGFPLNDYLGFFSNNKNSFKNLPFKKSIIGTIQDIKNYIEEMEKIRDKLDFEIDGLVIKINDLTSREILGYTTHHPRWAIAYKFDAPLAESYVESIDFQVGRGGRITPVANLKSVKLSGSIISRATLHNEDYINSLGINIGDKVTISKRGDVIPAVEEVIEKGLYLEPVKFPKNCPSCNSILVKDGSNIFCQNEECPKRLLGTLQFFVSKEQMDIETLGDKTLEFLFNNNFVKFIPDIYLFDYNKLKEYEGFKEKKINNIIKSIEESKKKDFKKVLSSLGLKDIGKKVSELLVNEFKNIDNIIEKAKLRDITIFTKINGIGETIALSIINHFTNEKVLNLIKVLKEIGLNFSFEEEEKYENQVKKIFENTKWVITGSFDNFKPREKASLIIKKYGGEVLDAISSKVNYLLVGFEPGSKLQKAKQLNIKIISESDFIKILKDNNIDY